MTTTAEAALEFAVRRSDTPVPDEERERILASPGFGRTFTDHMASITWTVGEGWHDARVEPYGPLTLDPATAVLHYAQAIFEGFKAYRQPDGRICSFRPDANARRFTRSARRLALPQLPEDVFVAAADLLVRTDRSWVPADGEKSLYLRPLMFASEVGIGVRPAAEVRFLVIASPAGSYFPHGVKPISIWLSEDYIRAAPGGTGAAKTAGNYAGSLVAQQEAIANGCDQVIFLDALERRWVEELGGMNVFFVHDDGSVVTPELGGTILEGITREAILTLAAETGHKVDERRVSLDEWRDGVESGRITEVFSCGTAAVVTPLGRLVWRGGKLRMGTSAGPVTTALRQSLLDIQYGAVPDRHGWLHEIC